MNLKRVRLNSTSEVPPLQLGCYRLVARCCLVAFYLYAPLRDIKASNGVL